MDGAPARFGLVGNSRSNSKDNGNCNCNCNYNCNYNGNRGSFDLRCALRSYDTFRGGSRENLRQRPAPGSVRYDVYDLKINFFNTAKFWRVYAA